MRNLLQVGFLSCTFLTRTCRFTAALLDNITIEEKDWWIKNPTLDDEVGDATSRTAVASSEHEKSSVEKDSGDGTKDAAGETTFHNRGFEIWEQCRGAWRNGSNECDGEEMSLRSAASPHKPMSKKQREKILLNVTRQREFKLPRKIRLDELINVYTEVWCHDSE